MKIKAYCLIIFGICMLTGCGTTKTKETLVDISDTSEVESMPKETIYSIYPEHESVVSLANDNVNKWLKDYRVGSVAAYYGKGDIYMPTPVVFSWECSKEATGYTLSLSRSSDMSNCTTVETVETCVEYEDLFVGTDYYWQLTVSYKGGSETSEIYHFTTADTPRTISLEGVSNVRDIGGYVTENGRKVKQGMVYRGGALDEITDDGKEKAINIYGIKTDLDLRRSGEGTAGTKSPLGADVRYLNIAGPYYVGNSSGIDDKWNWEELANEIRVFADESSYPLYMHCAIGRDRTGTLAFLINALLGASKEDLYHDYELSFFSVSGCKDGATVSNMIGNFGHLYRYIAYYGDMNRTLSEQTEQFLLDIGITKSEIDSIRSILLEK